MGRYDHRVHAGNAGDVWKHFLLMEAADFLLALPGRLVYAESHAGRPHYLLESPGEWEGGIGRIWHSLPYLKAFSYFQVLSELNPSSATSSRGLLYPGSARQIYELARRSGADLQARIWDNHPDVAASWQVYLQEETVRSAARPPAFSFHQSDGFSGLLSSLSRPSSDTPPAGLLFIDPPYVNPQDAPLAERLLQEARNRGWIVLWWHMTDIKTVPEGLDTFELNFSQAGLEGGRWKGAAVAVAGAEGELLSHLLLHLARQMEALIRILKSD